MPSLDLANLPFRLLWPFGILLGGIFSLLLAGTTKRFGSRGMLLYLSLAALVLSFLSVIPLFGYAPASLFQDRLLCDSFSHFFHLIFLVGGAIVVGSSYRYLEKESLPAADFFSLILLSIFGMMLMVSSHDLLVLFLGIEVMSFSLYGLVSYRRNDRKCNESAMKYFILGSTASAVFLYGVALIYGATQFLNLSLIAGVLRSSTLVPSPILILGTSLLTAGLLFKVAAVPFHLWAPDVYEGAPTPITGFMTVAVKAAAFAVFLRFALAMDASGESMLTLRNAFHSLIRVTAILTMIVGNLMAIRQTQLKRLFAYSSIAHTGYILTGFLAGFYDGYSAVVFYLLIYSIIALGVFTIFTWLSEKADGGLTVEKLTGLSTNHPGLAFGLTFFFISLAGLPPTGGFIAKYFIFYSAAQAGEIPLVIVAVITSIFGLSYYLRLTASLYLPPKSSTVSLPLTGTSGILIASLVAIILQIGLNPSLLYDWIKVMVIQ